MTQTNKTINLKLPQRNQNLLKVRVVSPKGVIFEGPALSVSSSNSMGKFDILGQHANFITLTQNTPLIIKTEKQVLKFNLPLSIIYNANNQVNIYTDLHLSV